MSLNSAGSCSPSVFFVLVLFIVRDHRMLQRYTYTAMLVGLAAVGAARCCRSSAPRSTARGSGFGSISAGAFQFQPAEVAKIVLIVFFAGYLVMKRDVLALARSRVLGIDLPRGRDLGPILVAWAASLAVLVFERDLGTSLLFFGLFVAMLYIATERRSWLIIGAGALRRRRVRRLPALRPRAAARRYLAHPFADEADDGYQIAQSLYGFATGGILGVGLGQGHPDFVPFAKTDFIMAAFGEELGLTGVMALLVLYAIIVERGMRTASRSATRSASCLPPAFDRGRHPGVRRRRRRHEADPADRAHDAVPLLRRLVARRQLGLVALLLRVSDGARRPPGGDAGRKASGRWSRA